MRLGYAFNPVRDSRAALSYSPCTYAQCVECGILSVQSSKNDKNSWAQAGSSHEAGMLQLVGVGSSPGRSGGGTGQHSSITLCVRMGRDRGVQPSLCCSCRPRVPAGPPAPPTNTAADPSTTKIPVIPASSGAFNFIVLLLGAAGCRPSSRAATLHITATSILMVHDEEAVCHISLIRLFQYFKKIVWKNSTCTLYTAYSSKKIS